MPRQRLVHDILATVGKESSRKKKIALLQAENQNKALVTLMKLTFDDNLVFDLPEGAPPYKPNELMEREGTSNLIHEIRKMKYFIKGRSYLTNLKRETLFIEVLEVIHPLEAKLLLAVKEGELPYNGITKKLIQDAFPGLIK